MKPDATFIFIQLKNYATHDSQDIFFYPKLIFDVFCFDWQAIIGSDYWLFLKANVENCQRIPIFGRYIGASLFKISLIL